MTDSIEVTGVVSASPETLFRAFLDAKLHAEMTGGATTADGDKFTAWDGYITGQTLEAQEPARIVQRWRTAEFPDDAADSRLEILLEAVGTGTKLRFRHSEIPEGQGTKYEQGWVVHYIEPMQRHFG